MIRDNTRADHAELEIDSVYRRRQKAVAISRRRSGSRWLRLARSAAKEVAIFLPLGGVMALVGWYALNSAHFALSGADAVMLTGNHYVTPVEVAAAIGAGAEPNILRLSIEDARRQIEAIPWVRSANLRRIYPNRLQVDIVEREPVADVNIGGTLKLVDENGVLLEKPAGASFDFPVLTGINNSMNMADRKLRLALFKRFEQELKAHSGEAGWLVSEVDLSDAEDLKALLVQGHQTYLVHFGNQDFGARFTTFLALRPEVEKATPAVDSVDLRYRGQAVVTPRESGRVAPGVTAPSDANP